MPAVAAQGQQRPAVAIELIVNHKPGGQVPFLRGLGPGGLGRVFRRLADAVAGKAGSGKVRLLPAAILLLRRGQISHAAPGSRVVFLPGRQQGQQRPGGLRGGAGADAVQFRVDIGAAAFPPTAIGILAGQQPIHRAAEVGLLHILADSRQSRQDGPGPVDIVDPPAPEPGAVGILFPAQETIGPLQGRIIPTITQAAQHFHHMGGNIGAGRIQHFPEIGKGQFRQIFAVVILVKGGPTAVFALQGQQPIHAATDGRLPARFLLRSQPGLGQGNDNLSSVIHIRVQVVVELERPAAGLRLGDAHLPIPRSIHLPCQQPAGGAAETRILRGNAGFQQGLLRQAGIPHRGNARLHHTAVFILDGKMVKAVVALFQGGMVGGKAPIPQGQQGINPGWLDAAPRAIRLLMLQHPLHDFPLGPAAEGFQRPLLIDAHQPIQIVKQAGQAEGRVGLGQGIVDFLARPGIKFVDARRRRNGADRAVGQDNQHWHDGAAGPAGKLVDVKGGPGRQQNQFRRHIGRPFPVPLPEQGQPDFGENPGFRHAALAQDEIPGPPQGFGFGGTAGQFQGKIALHRSAEVAGRAVILPPSAVILLLAEDVVDHLAPPLRILAIQKIGQQQIFGFHSGIGFQRPPPVAFGILAAAEIALAAGNNRIQLRGRRRRRQAGIKGCRFATNHGRVSSGWV